MKKTLTIWAWFANLMKPRKGPEDAGNTGQSQGESSQCQVKITFVFCDRNGKEHPVRLTEKGITKPDGSVLVVIRFRTLLTMMLKTKKKKE